MMTEEEITTLTKVISENELKMLAARMGYNIIKKPEPFRYVPCKICGGTRHTHYGVTYNDYDGNIYLDGTGLQCTRCGIMIKGKTETEAKHNWNWYMNGFELPECAVFEGYMKKEYKDENNR